MGQAITARAMWWEFNIPANIGDKMENRFWAIDSMQTPGSEISFSIRLLWLYYTFCFLTFYWDISDREMWSLKLSQFVGSSYFCCPFFVDEHTVGMGATMVSSLESLCSFNFDVEIG